MVKTGYIFIRKAFSFFISIFLTGTMQGFLPKKFQGNEKKENPFNCVRVYIAVIELFQFSTCFNLKNNNTNVMFEPMLMSLEARQISVYKNKRHISGVIYFAHVEKSLFCWMSQLWWISFVSEQSVFFRVMSITSYKKTSCIREIHSRNSQ